MNTHSSWLPGDPRGFRSHHRKIISTGDFNHPPPSGEHANLHQYSLANSAPRTLLPAQVYEPIGQAVLQNLHSQYVDVAALCVGKTHLHYLANLPDDVPRIKEIVGWNKRFATKAARYALPELVQIELWADGETYKPVDSAGHHASVINYLLKKQGSDVWTWSKADAAF